MKGESHYEEGTVFASCPHVPKIYQIICDKEGEITTSFTYAYMPPKSEFPWKGKTLEEYGKTDYATLYRLLINCA